MIRRNRDQATLTASGRRLRASARHEEELRERGIEPYAYETAAGGAAVARRRRGPSIKAILLLAVLLILVIALVGGILIWQRVAKFNDSVSTAPAASSALWGALDGTKRVNIALFGYGGAEHKSGNYLADSIQIISIDPKTKKTTSIPIPRDFWIEDMPEIPGNGKINQAFAVGHERDGVDGGARLTAKLLSEVTGLKIDYWIAIDFTGFEEMIDAVGGIEINNPRFFRYTWNEWKFRHNVWDNAFNRGPITLDGAQALDYARTRYTSVTQESSDFARSIRQQRVLRALRDKLGSGGFSSIGPGLAMMDALDGKMRTDLSAIDLFLLSSHLDPDRRIQLKEGRILEATTNTDGSYILVVVGRSGPSDYAPLKQFLRRELAKGSQSTKTSPSASP